MAIPGLLILAAAQPGAAAGQEPAELACAYDALAPAARSSVGRDYSLATAEGSASVAKALAPLLAACASRYGWDDARRRQAADYAGQRAELEARAATLPAAASPDRLNALFEAMPEADRKGMADAGISDAEFRAIGLRLRNRFDAAAIPRPAQGPAAGYLLALAHLRAIESSWAGLSRR